MDVYELTPTVLSIYLKCNSPVVPNPTVESTSTTVIPIPTSPIILVLGGVSYIDCITLNELDKMKKSSFIINTSRGEIINEDDLIIALSTNVIAGAGIDVYEKEPLPENNKLRFLPNALLTPHIGYVTSENYEIFYSQMIESLESCVNGKPIRVIE